MHIRDICIIGAGPNAIATIARLREQTPSSLYTEAEHVRFHWLKKYDGLSRADRKHPGPSRKQRKEHDILVLDNADDYMASWNKAFAALQISHLRSPMFFHVDASDVDALVSFAHSTGQQNELQEITNVVGKEQSKHKQKTNRNKRKLREPAINERDRQDYFTPSTKLFHSFCRSLIERYSMPPVTQGRVVDVIPFEHEGQTIFEIKTADGNSYYARYVISAVGHANTPCIPCSLQGCAEGACHSSQIAQAGSVLCPHLSERIKKRIPTKAIICGGGLTSAQIADVAIRSGIDKVYLMCRGGLKVKPFDVDLAWIGKYQNEMKSRFFVEDCPKERLKIVLEARNGGSVTPTYNKILQQHIKSGRLEILLDSQLQNQCWDPLAKHWTVEVKSQDQLTRIDQVDYLYFATGAKWDISRVGFLQTILSREQDQCLTGFPRLSEDLQWKDLNLFVVGGFAALQIGPGAFNLEGARACAERVALRIEELENVCGGDWRSNVLNGTGSVFSALEVE